MSNIEIIYPDPGRRLWNEELTQFVLGKSTILRCTLLVLLKIFFILKMKTPTELSLLKEKEHHTTTADVKG